MAKKVLPKRRRLSGKRGGRFAVRALPVVLAGSAHESPGDHVVGRPVTNYLMLPPGNATVDAIADRLSGPTALKKQQRRETLRTAVLSAHEAGARKIMEFNNSDRASQAAAAFRALRALSPFVIDPTFIPSIYVAASIVEAENPTFGEWARDLARGLEHVTLFESVVADEQRRAKPVRRKNPGKPYMAGLAESLVASWHEWTGEFPSKTRVLAERTKSRRVLFWHFADAALADLSLQAQPFDHHVRTAIDRLQKTVRSPAK